jgi:hypothetical protein
VRRRVVDVLFASLLLAVVPVLAGCGSAEPAGEGDALTVEQALKSDAGQPIKVQGAIVAKDGTVVLASVLLESYPPQAGGATLPVEGLDLESLVGLSTTADKPNFTAETWSDYWVVLGGGIEDGVLKVQSVPRAVQTESTGVRVRFSPVFEPLVAGGNVWWAFDVKNLQAMPLDLVFASGQRGEVVLAQNGVEKYRWSAGKAFTEAIETVTLEPSKSFSVVLNDSLSVAPGDYELTATVTASVGPAEGPGTPGSGIRLAELKTTVAVR